MGDKKSGFAKCPVCGGELKTGKMSIPASRSIYPKIQWRSDENFQKCREHPLKSFFTMQNTAEKVSFVGSFKEYPIPAGFCENCNKIFAEFEVADAD